MWCCSATRRSSPRLTVLPLLCSRSAARAERRTRVHTALCRAGLAKLRAGAPPSEAERALFSELRDNIVSCAALVPPRLLLPQEQPPMQTFMATSRAMGARLPAQRAPHASLTPTPVTSSAGLLPLPRDFAAPEPPPEQAAAAQDGGGAEQRTTRATRRLAPGERAKLRRRMAAPPKGFTGREFHKLNNLEGVEFFEEAVVLDVDEAGNATKGALASCSVCRGCFALLTAAPRSALHIQLARPRAWHQLCHRRGRRRLAAAFVQHLPRVLPAARWQQVGRAHGPVRCR